MGIDAKSLAILDGEGRVVTFVRMDVPDGWRPPQGYTAVPDDELPEGWQMSPESQPPVPQTITAWQIRRWLVLAGISLAQVDAVINAIEDDTQRELTRVDWDWAPYIERSHPMLVPLAAAMGMTEEQIDQAFREAYMLGSF